MTDSHELAEQLRAAIGKLVRTVRATDTLPPGEAAILGLLDRDGPQTTADLARQRGVSHQSAATSVQLLLSRDLLHAKPDPVDRRKRLLDLTPAGRTRLQQERQRRAGWLDAAIENELTPEEREELERCVRLLARLTAYLRVNRYVSATATTTQHASGAPRQVGILQRSDGNGSAEGPASDKASVP